jgi:hypothetical protein
VDGSDQTAQWIDFKFAGYVDFEALFQQIFTDVRITRSNKVFVHDKSKAYIDQLFLVSFAVVEVMVCSVLSSKYI